MKDYSVDKSAIKALVTLHGPREAARLAELPVGTVLSWSRRYKWKKAVISGPKLSSGTKPGSAITGKDPADVLRESLENARVNSTLHLADYVEKASKKASQSKDPLSVARKVRDVAGVYQVLYPPEEGSELIEGSILIGAAKVTDNVQEIEALTLPAESHVSRLIPDTSDDVRQELPDNRPAGD